MHSKISKKRRGRARPKSYKPLAKKHRSSKKVHHKRVKSRRRKRIMRPSRRPSRRYHALRKHKNRKQKGGGPSPLGTAHELVILISSRLELGGIGSFWFIEPDQEREDSAQQHFLQNFYKETILENRNQHPLDSACRAELINNIKDRFLADPRTITFGDTECALPYGPTQADVVKCALWRKIILPALTDIGAWEERSRSRSNPIWYCDPDRSVAVPAPEAAGASAAGAPPWPHAAAAPTAAAAAAAPTAAAAAARVTTTMTTTPPPPPLPSAAAEEHHHDTSSSDDD